MAKASVPSFKAREGLVLLREVPRGSWKCRRPGFSGRRSFLRLPQEYDNRYLKVPYSISLAHLSMRRERSCSASFNNCFSFSLKSPEPPLLSMPFNFWLSHERDLPKYFLESCAQDISNRISSTVCLILVSVVFITLRLNGLMEGRFVIRNPLDRQEGS